MKHKRQRTEEGERLLQPCALTCRALPLHASKSAPGPLFGNRIAAQVDAAGDVWAFVGCGQDVYCTKLPSQTASNESVARGKEGALLPARKELEHPLQPLPGLHSSAEIQSLALAQLGPADTPHSRTAVCCMDARGRGLVSLSDNPSGSGDCTGASTSSDGGGSLASLGMERPTYVLHPPRQMEAGWSGACMREDPNSGELSTATASHFGQSINFYQGSTLVRSAHTLHPPAALTWLPRDLTTGTGSFQNVCACAEGNQVSLWDVRQGEQGGLAFRTSVAPGGSPVYGLDWCNAEGGLLGTAGAERSLKLCDPRRSFSVIHKWPGCTKYTCHYLHFSRSAPNWAFLAGRDLECICGRWTSGGSGTAAGNMNSSSVGHGRAAGPASVISAGDAADGAMDEQEPQGAGSSFRFEFRFDARACGMVRAETGCTADRDTLVASTQSHRLFSLDARPM